MRINELLKGIVSVKDLLTGKKPLDKNAQSRAIKSQHAGHAYAAAIRRGLTHVHAQVRRLNTRGLPVGVSRHDVAMSMRLARDIFTFPTKLVPSGGGECILVPKSDLRRQIFEDTRARCEENIKARSKMKRPSKIARRVMNTVHA
jgi:hypothetical protein